MSDKKIIHEIKIELSIKLILLAAVALLGLQVIGPSLSIKSAMAELNGGVSPHLPFHINLVCTGCAR